MNAPDQTEHLQRGADHVTVSVVREVIPGQEEDYERWVSGVCAAAAAFPGNLGVNILRPSMGYNQYTVIYRFDTEAHAEDWQQSAVRKAWTDKLTGIVQGETHIRAVTGLESWFDLPTIPVAKQPVRWRMCVVLTIVVFSLLTALNGLLAPLLEGINPHLRTAAVVTLQVILMTYLVMPRITARLKHWLYQ